MALLDIIAENLDKKQLNMNTVSFVISELSDRGLLGSSNGSNKSQYSRLHLYT